MSATLPKTEHLADGRLRASRDPEDVVITPLTKKTLAGKLYERDPKIEAALIELSLLPRDVTPVSHPVVAGVGG